MTVGRAGQERGCRCRFGDRAPCLVVALALIVGLGWIGRDVESKLNPTSLDVPGTDANRANKMLEKYFGDSAPFAILLQGPPEQIEEQGPALVHALRATDPKVTTVSPWDKGKVGNLRPAPNKALILADFHVDINDAVRYTVDELNEILDREGETAGRGDPDRLRHPLAGDPGRIDPRHPPQRADRPADPAARPAARLPLAGRGDHPAHLRGDHGDHLARGPGAALLGDLDRRLRADRQHDDGVSPGGGLRPVDGLPLPRRARRRGRAPSRRRRRRGRRRGGPRSSPAAPCSWRWSSRCRSCPARCSSPSPGP